ncbi:MAG: lipopolysaccharide biosynthesis protein [Acidobacteriia bacterium]|nr:lipopolysaccharide biosynthesis protein [Terriglobia bacterium]
MKFSSAAPVRQPLPELPEEALPGTSPEPQTRESSQKSLAALSLLWERRRLLFRIALYALLASTVAAFLIPARYESTARLMPPDNQSGSSLAMAAAAMSGAAGGLGGIASDLLGLKSTSDVFVGILGSRTVQDKLIQQFDLKKLYGDRRMEDARNDLANHTGISVDRKSQIITITVTDKSPQRAAAMAQAYVEELNRLVAELSTSSARRERIFLEERLQAVSQDLKDAEKNFSQFASKNTAIDIKEQGKAMVDAAATLQGQLIAAESELQGLKQTYTDSNVRVRSVQARIDELKHQLDKLGGKGESMTEVSGQPGDSLYPSIRKLPLLGVTYADLYRRTRIQEAVLEALTKEYEMAKVQEAKEIPTVTVLDVANLPDKKAFPPRFSIMFLGTFLGSCFGVLFVLGSASWNAIDPQDPGKQFAAKIWTDLKAHAPWVTRNGAGTADGNYRVLNEVDSQGGRGDEQE